MTTRGLHVAPPPLRSSPSFAVLDRAATGRTVPELARFFDAHLPYVMGFLNVSPAAPDPAPTTFVLPWLSFDANTDATATTPKPAHASVPAINALNDAVPTPVVAPAAVLEVDEAVLVRAVASDPILRSAPSPLIDCNADVRTDLVEKTAVLVAVDRIELGPGRDQPSIEPAVPMTDSALIASITSSGGSGPSLDGTTIDGISASIVSTPRESPALRPIAPAHVGEDVEEPGAVEVEELVITAPPPPPPLPPLPALAPAPVSALKTADRPRPRLVRRRTGLPPRSTSPKRTLPTPAAPPAEPPAPRPPASPQTVPYPSSPRTAAIPSPLPPLPPPPAPPSIISDAAAPDPLAPFPRLAMWAESLRALHGSNDGDDDDRRMSTDTASTSLAASPVPTPTISPRGSLATMRTSSGTWSTASISSSRSAPAWAARPSLPPDMEHIHGMVALRLQRLPNAARRASTAPSTSGGMRQSVRHLWTALHDRRSNDHYGGSSLSGSAPAWLRTKSAHSGVALALAEEALWKRLGTIVDRSTAQIVLADHFNHLCEQLVIDVTTCRPPARALRKLGKVAAALMDTRAYFSLVAVAAALWTLTTATPHANEPEWHLAAADRLAMHAVLHFASPAGRFAALRDMMLRDAAAYTAVPLADRARVEASRRVCEWLWAM
ncbi:hypothetical protein AMAG_07752 [Allomyces macrogynus ATCC 38327]|uniref:Uncharacterized protein n=1 Tax=Allomyces macrogynus (strain ATCC 38327) TaxID=578462 RepID=A0A0L0SJ64_ALLM3|nr:hypothetical protein AMAG_07752 [Allomyces macrogynus ATCC 38327]|eukprot:KNE62543.1 hypothetical protein AMAG_07752 [Allomyces macrogynus ATCC 38327]